jgi:hypothetical protein
MHPANHAHLAPSYTFPSVADSTYFQNALACSLAVPLEFDPSSKTVPTPFPLSVPFQALRGRGCGFIPDALLMTCRQVYEEARIIPWEANEYVFVNWFCSGVYAARAFLRTLQPWQRTAMRFARIEVLGRDLKNTWVATMAGGKAGGGEWKDLCGLWVGGANGDGGLWGLRLSIEGRVTAVSIEADGSVAPGTEMIGDQDYQRRLKGALDVGAEWVTQGLALMRSLRWLELEISDKNVRREDKMAFCAELGMKLNEIGGIERRIDVIFVEDDQPKAKTAGRNSAEVSEPENASRSS